MPGSNTQTSINSSTQTEHDELTPESASETQEQLKNIKNFVETGINKLLECIERISPKKQFSRKCSRRLTKINCGFEQSLSDKIRDQTTLWKTNRT